MKKILIVFIIAIMIIAFWMLQNYKRVLMKESDTKIAYWDLSAYVLDSQKFSLSDTAIKTLNTNMNYIAPRFKREF